MSSNITFLSALLITGVSLISFLPTIAANEDDDHYLMKSQCLEALQQQINEELHASLMYLNMAAHFHHTEVGRKGFFRLFESQSDEEKKHAHKLIYYINKRGGRVTTFNVRMPLKATWTSAEEAVRDAISLEKELNGKLYAIHKIAERTCADPHLMDFLEGEFLEEQIASISQLKKLLTSLTSFDDGNRETGEFLVDKQLLKEESRKYYQEEL